jgi:hypothetical protein
MREELLAALAANEEKLAIGGRTVLVREMETTPTSATS